MKSERMSLRSSAAYYLFGGIALALVTLAGVQLNFNLATAAFCYLVLIALVGMRGNMAGSVVFSIVATACLNYFFIPTFFTFDIDSLLDGTLLMAFLTASLIVSVAVARSIGVAHTARDEQKSLEQAQRDLRAVIDVIPGLVWGARPDGSAFYLSQRWLEYTGCSLESVVDWGWTKVVHPDDLPKLTEDWQAICAAGKSAESEARMRRHDGAYRWFLFRAEPLRDDMGNVVKWYGMNVDIEDRRRMEETLRRNEAQFADAQRLSRTGSLVYIPSTDEHHWSDETARIYGYEGNFTPSTELVLQRIHPDDRAILKEQFARAATGATHFDFQHRLLMPDGTMKYVHALGHTVKGEGGRDEIAGALMDITAAKRAEDALRRSEAFLTEAQRLSRVGSFGWTPSTGEIHWSEESYRIFEIDPAVEPTADLVIQRVHPEDVALVRQWFDLASAGEQDFEVMHRLLMADGSVKYLQVLSHALRDESGKLEIVGAVMDITAARSTEETLRENEQRFRDYAETASDWLWETAPDHRFTQISVRLKAAGVDPSSAVGMTRWEAASGVEEEPEKWRRHKAALDAHLPFRGFTYQISRGDGSTLYVSTSGKPKFDAEGRFLGHRGVGTDITAIVRAEQAEQALHRAQAELAHVTRVTTLGELTASIAHEVNQPLAAIVANGDACLRWLDRIPADLGKARESVESIISDGNRASDVVGRIRALSKGSMPQKAPLNVNDLIDEVILLVRREVMSGGVSVQLALAPALPPVLGDRVQLQQVIINLVINGIQAMAPIVDRPRDMTIESRCLGDAEQVLIAVRDSGIGIDTDTANRLFDAFFTTKSGGLGMGLSICRSIVEAHGGRVWASTNDGPGATFQFTLNASEEAES